MITYEFDPHADLELIILVGVGGTGSQWARQISRMIYDMRRRSIKTPDVLFVDPDRVEEKNVGRQMFTATDVGKYKAEVLARRFNHALGLDIAYRTEPFDRVWFRRGGTDRYSEKQVLLCGAVDNHQARIALAGMSAIWIDAGNHFSSGQVVIGNTGNSTDVLRYLSNDAKRAKTMWLPNAAAVFPNLLKPEGAPSPVEQSCADLVAMGDQHLLINDLIATVAAGYTFNLLYRQPIKSFVTYVDVLSLAVRSVPITRDDLETYLVTPEPVSAVAIEGVGR